mmetsp:Transcript_22520/g.39289  ORF Transcript_22520/g.39289 Transcript_22520/m.39289 type:complete len:197 (+) Transcript_22520:53-643(+)|eukprot:CAMPEP_0194580426 /NCGR_PEP_ID=MMETSP0292-20121207/14196_1 /TAXON_ID=39354 /ORGANISM="Heterosigma akashiwo, Strain CCMP2393" /LENGTH=196 /DNA_ID=CAMNT_0039433773 /DNA_START=53 /DNA_END=643 /DNA_ORIENTATION=+
MAHHAYVVNSFEELGEQACSIFKSRLEGMIKEKKLSRSEKPRLCMQLNGNEEKSTDRIRQEMEISNNVIVLMTTNFMLNPRILEEVTIARHLDKRIICVQWKEGNKGYDFSQLLDYQTKYAQQEGVTEELVQALQKRGYGLEEVQTTLQRVFSNVYRQFSIDGSPRIMEAEMVDLVQIMAWPEPPKTEKRRACCIM